MELIEYELTADHLCMGERLKAGTFRPCAQTIRYSQITGALRKKFGDEKDLHAVGYLVEEEGFNQLEYLTYSPRDRSLNLSKLPLQIEFLVNVKGKVFLPVTDTVENLPEEFDLTMGALLSKGFGRCKLAQKELISSTSEKGRIPQDPERDYVLNVRLPEKYCSLFGIRKVLKPIYGYLFESRGLTSGVYARSLFEGSVVIAPVFLLKKVR